MTKPLMVDAREEDGIDVVRAEPERWVFTPRRQWRTFWNAGETPREILRFGLLFSAL